MFLDIDSIIYYGRYYSCDCHKYENLWWFSLMDYAVYSVDELIENYGFCNYDEICSSCVYIPMFKTDIISAEKHFMNNYYNSKKIDQLEKDSLDYDAAFKTFIESERIDSSWHEYERAVLYNDAVLWCKKNNIAYRK